MILDVTTLPTTKLSRRVSRVLLFAFIKCVTWDWLIRCFTDVLNGTAAIVISYFFWKTYFEP